jgi:hypothetical protein
MDQENIDKVMAELRAKFPEPSHELVPLQLGRCGFFVLRNPTAQEHMFFTKQAIDDSQQALASPNLFAATCVYPDRAEVTSAMARWPGMVRRTEVQKALQYLSGQTDSLEGKG